MPQINNWTYTAPNYQTFVVLTRLLADAPNQNPQNIFYAMTQNPYSAQFSWTLPPAGQQTVMPIVVSSFACQADISAIFTKIVSNIVQINYIAANAAAFNLMTAAFNAAMNGTGDFAGYAKGPSPAYFWWAGRAQGQAAAPITITAPSNIMIFVIFQILRDDQNARFGIVPSQLGQRKAA